jgi:hypothetical protein
MKRTNNRQFYHVWATPLYSRESGASLLSLPAASRVARALQDIHLKPWC